MKKAQITFFVIIGIVVLGSIFLVYNLLHSSTEKKSEVEQQKQVDIQAKIKKYNKYIDSCLEQTTTEGLVLLGRQGGAIFEAENGIPGALQITDVKSLKYKDKTETKTTVAYGLTAPKFFGNHPDVPQYPYGIVKLVKDPKSVYNIQNPFGNYPGFMPLVPLCDLNRLTEDQKKLFFCGTHPNSYDLNKPESFSIQDLLEKYINEKVKSCIKLENFPELKELVDQGKAVLGEANTTIVIKEEGVEAVLTLSGKIINEGQQSDIAFIKNKVLVPIHIKQIHALVSYLIKNDINNIFFDMTQDAANEDMQLCDAVKDGKLIKYQCLKQKMKIYKLNNVGISSSPNDQNNDPAYDDILVIEDSSKLIDGEPYRFQVALQNRVPAIDLIKDLSAAEDLESHQMVELGKYVDIVLEAGSAAQIEVKAYDPDEDFHIAGAMDQQSYAMYSTSTSAPCIVNPNDVLDKNKFDSIISSFESCDLLSTDTLVTEVSFPELGYYPIKIVACDDANKCDYQLARVLVFSKPES